MLLSRFSLTKFYERPEFKRTQSPITAGAVFRWWESRRHFFNLVVGCTGILTCFLMFTCAFISEATIGIPLGMSSPLFAILGVIAFGFVANIFYTTGWVLELLARGLGTSERASAFGVKLSRLGITFSIGVTLFPALLCWLLLGATPLLKALHLVPINK